MVSYYTLRLMVKCLMPQTITCKKCSKLLYKGADLKPAEEIVQHNGGHCPGCGNKLGFKMEDVKIGPLKLDT